MTAEYTVQRTIADVEFEEERVDEIRKKVRKDLIDEGRPDAPDSVVEQRVKERLVEIARDDTLHSQGDNRLHNDIDHELVED